MRRSIEIFCLGIDGIASRLGSAPATIFTVSPAKAILVLELLPLAEGAEQASRQLRVRGRNYLFMPVLPLYWIKGFTDGHLAIMPAPQPQRLEGAVLFWKQEGIDIVVSLLEFGEIPGFIEAESELCDKIGLEFFWFPIRDGSVPASESTFNGLIARLGDALAMGKSVAIHCRAGIGRSALVAAGVLNYLHIAAEAALDMVAAARKLEVPQTERQRQWLLSFTPVSRREDGIEATARIHREGGDGN